MLPSKHCARPTSRPSTAHWAWVRYRDSTSPRKQAMPCALECAPRRARAGRRRGARTARAAPGARPAPRRPRRGRAPRRPCPPASACARAAAPDGAACTRCPAERVFEQAHSARASTASCTLHHCRTLIKLALKTRQSRAWRGSARRRAQAALTDRVVFCWCAPVALLPAGLDADGHLLAHAHARAAGAVVDPPAQRQALLSACASSTAPVATLTP